MKLYVGLSPYWQLGSKASELAIYYYDKLFCLWTHALFSYYYVKDFEKWMEVAAVKTDVSLVDIMLDSGAFSIWSTGGEIDLAEYTKYAVHLQEINSFKNLAVVSLDKIPGSRSKITTRAMILAAANESFKNYMFMCERGLRNVIAVYHLGEPLSCLKRFLDEGADYIGLGGIARGVGSGARRQWLDGVFSFLKQHSLSVRVHGFGVTAIDLIMRYPWYSVDSVTPMLAPGLGNVSVFDEAHKKVRNIYVQGIAVDKQIFLSDQAFLEARFGVPFKDLTMLWCRRYFTQVEWLKFIAWLNQKDGSMIQKVLQPSLGLNDL